jgi:hypothetical protein
LQVLAALANVKQPIRGDAVTILRRLFALRLFSSSEVRNLLRALFEISGSLQSVNTSKQVKNFDDKKQSVYAAIEELLEIVVEQRASIELGEIEPKEWTLSAILSKVLWPTRDIQMELGRFLSLLGRQGEDECRERIEALAFEAGLIRRDSGALKKQNDGPERRPKAQSKSTGTVFSKLSLLMRDGDSD